MSTLVKVSANTIQKDGRCIQSTVRLYITTFAFSDNMHTGGVHITREGVLAITIMIPVDRLEAINRMGWHGLGLAWHVRSCWIKTSHVRIVLS